MAQPTRCPISRLTVGESCSGRTGNGGGIYVMPSLGGDARLVAGDGFNPRFSPDGSHVAFWVGPRSVAASVPGSGAVWVVPVGGGEPMRVGRNFTTARYPIWHKDGKHLLILGTRPPKRWTARASTGGSWQQTVRRRAEPARTMRSCMPVCSRASTRGRRFRWFRNPVAGPLPTTR